MEYKVKTDIAAKSAGILLRQNWGFVSAAAGTSFVFIYFTSADSRGQALYFLILVAISLVITSIRKFYSYELEISNLSSKVSTLETEIERDNSTSIREVDKYSGETLVILDQRRWLKVGQLLSVYENSHNTSVKPLFILEYMYQTHRERDNGFPVCKVSIDYNHSRTTIVLDNITLAKTLIVVSYVNVEVKHVQ